MVFNYIIIASIVLGLCLILSTVIKRKPSSRKYKVNTKNINFRDLFITFEKNKFIGNLINGNAKNNIKLKSQLRCIGWNITLEGLFATKIILYIVLVILFFGIRSNFANMIKNTQLNPITIYSDSQYRIDPKLGEIIVRIIGDDYKVYIKNGDLKGLNLRIKEIVTTNNLFMIDEDIEKMVGIYQTTYTSTTLQPLHIVLIFLINIFIVHSVNFIISILYKIRRADMLKEFENLEIITILLMNREELNVLDIIKVMEHQAKYLKPFFTKCLNSFPNNPALAINTLIQEVDENDFRNFMIILRGCLDSGKQTNREMLKIQRELRLVLEETSLNAKSRRKSLYLTLAQFPLIICMGINLILPILSKINLNF